MNGVIARHARQSGSSAKRRARMRRSRRPRIRGAGCPPGPSGGDVLSAPLASGRHQHGASGLEAGSETVRHANSSPCSYQRADHEVSAVLRSSPDLTPPVQFRSCPTITTPAGVCTRPRWHSGCSVESPWSGGADAGGRVPLHATSCRGLTRPARLPPPAGQVALFDRRNTEMGRELVAVSCPECGCSPMEALLRGMINSRYLWCPRCRVICVVKRSPSLTRQNST
jgi:hypothetical protein